MTRQRVRNLLLIMAFLLFPITIFYFSPYLIVMGALEGIASGSAITFLLMLVFSVFFGRAWCAYLCPAGGLQELAFTVNDKPARLGWRKYIKWVIWAIWIASIVVCFFLAGGLREVDPFFETDNGISVTSVFALVIYYVIVALFLIPNLFAGRRAMCHDICWMAPFMIIGMKAGECLHLPGLHIATDPESCIRCGKCTKQCPMSLDVEELMQAGQITDAECIQCGGCVDCCPKGALRYDMGRRQAVHAGIRGYPNSQPHRRGTRGPEACQALFL